MPSLPTRVLDLGPVEHACPTRPKSIRLHISDGEKGEYVTLSHCWGGTSTIRSTEATLDVFKKGLDYDALPQTFKDAVDVTRWLGIRYLWIDSLCIIQDNHRDWEVESAKMATFYEAATFTLAASAAPNGDYGLFGSRRALEPTYIPPKLPAAESGSRERCGTGYVVFFEDSRTNPLQRRAWVLQEQVLSRRILSFEKKSVTWACAEARAGMNDGGSFDEGLGMMLQGPVLLSDPGPHCRVGLRNSGTMGRRGLIDPSLSSRFEEFSLSGLWYLLIQDYSRKQLTFLSDKLPALAGLAQLYQGTMKEDKFLAGLWLSDILIGLMWRHIASDAEKSRGRPKELEKMPSWSWVSVSGPVAWLKMYVSDVRTDLVMQTPEVEYASEPLTSQIVRAKLTFLSLLEPVIIGAEKIGGHRINSRHLHRVWRRDRPDGMGGERGVLLGTCLPDYFLEENEQIFAMYLMTHDNLEQGDHTWGDSRTVHDVILVRPTGVKGEYRRVGVGWFNAPGEPIVFHPGCCAYQTITLV